MAEAVVVGFAWVGVGRAGSNGKLQRTPSPALPRCTGGGSMGGELRGLRGAGVGGGGSEEAVEVSEVEVGEEGDEGGVELGAGVAG